MQKVSKKVILLGHFGVGKTSLVRRFVHQKFSEEYQTTIGVKIDKKVIVIENDEITMIIWDIEGRSAQSKLPKSYFMGAHGILYVFDLARPNTFGNIEGDLSYFRDLLPQAKVRVVGNKKDLLSEDQLNKVQQELADQVNAYTSAKTGERVDDMFRELGVEMLGKNESK